MPTIYDRLTPLFREVFDDDTVVATAQLTANDVENWDSLSHVRLMVAIEEDFKIHFSSSEITSFKTVGDLVTSIEAKLRG
jgi:acyl carrier protein